MYKDIIEKYLSKYYVGIVIMIISIILYYLVPINIITILIVSFSIIIYGITVKDDSINLLNSKLLKFLSVISFEIYLSHMVGFRLIEKLNLVNILSNNYIQFIFTSLLTIVITILFVMCVRFFIVKANEMYNKFLVR